MQAKLLAFPYLQTFHISVTPNMELRCPHRTARPSIPSMRSCSDPLEASLDSRSAQPEAVTSAEAVAGGSAVLLALDAAAAGTRCRHRPRCSRPFRNMFHDWGQPGSVMSEHVVPGDGDTGEPPAGLRHEAELSSQCGRGLCCYTGMKCLNPTQTSNKPTD